MHPRTGHNPTYGLSLFIHVPVNLHITRSPIANFSTHLSWKHIVSASASILFLIRSEFDAARSIASRMPFKWPRIIFSTLPQDRTFSQAAGASLTKQGQE